MSVIQRIKELREKATQDKWEFQEVEKEGGLDIDYGIYSFAEDRLIMFSGIEDMALSPNDVEYIVALHNTFPQLIQEHEALLRFVRKVRNIQIGPDEYYESSPLSDASREFGRAIKALDKELKG